MFNKFIRIGLIGMCLGLLVMACKQNPRKEFAPNHSIQDQSTVQQTDTALFTAALDGDSPRLARIVGGGVNVNLMDKENRTALMYAAYNGHTEMVTYLLEKGANVNMNDVNGRTALMFAASGPFAETVAVLLEHGAEINRTDFQEHYTALMYAASEGQAAVVKVLLEHQADPLLKDADGETALTFARNNSHPEVAELLVSLTESAR
jgi:uncharacterized protein